MKHAYFAAETKGNDIKKPQIRGAEDAKVAPTSTPRAAGDVAYSMVRTYQDFVQRRDEVDLLPQAMVKEESRQDGGMYFSRSQSGACTPQVMVPVLLT